MDVCCLNRPFDDLSENKVYFEAEAVLSIITYCAKNDWSLLSSSVIDYELSKNPNADKLEKVLTLYSAAKNWLGLTEESKSRAAFFQRHGIKALDSLHLALAETGEADIFLTTDARLLRAASKLNLKIRIANPVSWLMEVMDYER
jgi:predicted nucleic acid-binding protein